MHRIVVDRILIPHALHKVDMPDKHSVTRQPAVPTFLLTVLKQKIFIGIGRHTNDATVVGVL